jgi:osmotically-inducible protein OsmY
MATVEQLTERIEKALHRIDGLPHANIHVTGSEALVILCGNVDYSWQKDATHAVVQGFRPQRIQNDIVVRQNSP